MDITTVRLLATNLRPYYAKAMFRYEFIEVPDIGTITADKHFRLYYDQATLDEWTVQQSAAKMIQLTEHLVREHAKRREDQSATPNRWGTAAEEELSDSIEHSQLNLPEGLARPADYDHEPNKIAEYYYRNLPEDPEQGGGTGDGQGGAGDGEGEPGEGSSNNKGSCAGCPNDYEQGGPSKDQPGVSEVEAEIISDQTAKEIQDFVSRHPGKVPGSLERWANTRLKPKVDYRKELKSVVSKSVADKAGQTDYTYSKISRRDDSSGVVFPSMRSPTVKIGVLLDSSGSMTARYEGESTILDQATSEVAAVLKQTGATEIEFASCDTNVHGKKVHGAKDIHAVGGGGTDMCEGINYFDKLPRSRRPDVLITITDGYTPWPDRGPRGLNHIAVILEDEGHFRDYCKAPTWGKVLYRPPGGRFRED